MATNKSPLDPILEKALAVAGRAADALRNELLILASKPMPAPVFMLNAQRLIEKAEPHLRAALRAALLAAYLKPSEPLLRALPPPAPLTPGLPEILPAVLPEPFGPSLLIPPGQPPGQPAIVIASGDEPPPIRFPLIERAAGDLFRRNLFTRADFDDLDAEARRLAFTVSRVGSIETLGQLRDLLTESAAKGSTLREFQNRAATVLEESPLSRPHLETVFRTNLATAYSTGQRELLDHPLIGEEFPYMLWTAVHDSRVRPDHLAMEKAGIQRTAYFRRDDPLFRKVYPPASYNCRCHVIPITLEDAAAAGITEAKAWLQTGEPPAKPSWVSSVPIIQPPGWVSSGLPVAV